MGGAWGPTPWTLKVMYNGKQTSQKEKNGKGPRAPTPGMTTSKKNGDWGALTPWTPKVIGNGKQTSQKKIGGWAPRPLACQPVKKKWGLRAPNPCMTIWLSCQWVRALSPHFFLPVFFFLLSIADNFWGPGGRGPETPFFLLVVVLEGRGSEPPLFKPFRGPDHYHHHRHHHHQEILIINNIVIIIIT